MENNSYSGPVLILVQKLWAKTRQRSPSTFTKQPKTHSYLKITLLYIASSVLNKLKNTVYANGLSL